MYIAGSQAQDQIASSDHIPKIAMYALQPRLISHGAVAMGYDLINNRLSADVRKRRFTRRINVGDNNAVGIIESSPEFAPQRLCPRVTMRLKHRENPIASG